MGRLLKLLHSDGAAAGPAGPSTLQSIIPSAVMDLDATISSSYSGSGQTWSNLIAAPADGQIQTAYDFMLGSTSGVEGADPAFTGTPGDPAAYFAAAVGDFFTIKNGNTPFIKGMHKTTGGNVWSFILVGQFPQKAPSGSGVGMALFGNGGHDDTKIGFDVSTGNFFQSPDDIIWRQNGAGNNFQTVGHDLSGAPIGVLVFTFNPATGAYKVYHKDSTPRSVTLSGTGPATDPSYAFQILAAGNGGFPTNPSGATLVAAAACNAILSDADVTAIRSFYGTRHSRTY